MRSAVLAAPSSAAVAAASRRCASDPALWRKARGEGNQSIDHGLVSQFSSSQAQHRIAGAVYRHFESLIRESGRVAERRSHSREQRTPESTRYSTGTVRPGCSRSRQGGGRAAVLRGNTRRRFARSALPSTYQCRDRLRPRSPTCPSHPHGGNTCHRENRGRAHRLRA